MALTETAPTATAPTGRTATEPTVVTDEPAFPALGRLVGASALDRFLRAYLGREVFRRRLPDGEASRLFSWDLLNEALAAHRLGPPRLKLEKGGKEVSRAAFRERRPRPNQTLHDIDAPALYAALRDGATLVLDAVNELHPPLRALCADLAGEFVAHSQANLYACWGESQGFDVHWDDHDVFVVQIEGAKRWDLYGFTRPAPVRSDPAGAPQPTRSPEQIVLRGGDMLYLPRGYWHAAVGVGSPSLHLTIGLSRKTGADLLHWLADEAVASDSVRADLRLEQGDAALGAQIADILRALAGASDPAELGRRYRRHLQATARHRPQLSFPHLGRPQDTAARASRVRLAAGATDCRRGPDGRTVQLSHRGTLYTLAGATEPAISALASGEAATLGELLARCPEIAEPQLQAFVQDMLGRGVFVLESDA